VSRLFAVTKSLEEIVAHFAVDMAPAVEVPSETVEDTPGLIVIEKDGLRRFLGASMTLKSCIAATGGRAGSPAKASRRRDNMLM
jgi:hypothetical protein